MSGDVPTTVDLLERDAAMAALEAAWTGVAAGGCAVVTGDAGLGKTCVLDAFKRRLVDEQAVLLTARGSELEQGFPFGVVRQLLEHAVMALPAGKRRRVLGGPAAAASHALGIGTEAKPSATDPQPPFAIEHALYWVLGNLAAERPLALLVDDAHWADSESASWLAYVARRSGDFPVLLVVAARDHDPAAGTGLLADLRQAPQIVEVRLDPLSADGVAQILKMSVGDVDSTLVDACRQATGGNPFLVSELAQELDRADTPADAAAVANLGPASIARSAVARMASLSTDAVAVGRALAVLESAGARELRQLTGLAPDALATAIDDLARAGIVSGSLPVEFRHPVVRAAIDRELPPMQRAAAHRAAAQVRFDLGSGVDTVVAHLQHVEPAADAWVASMLIEGARSALARSAPGSALTLLDRALAEPPPPALRFGVLRDAAFAALAVGRPDSAARLQRAMDETVDPLDAAPLARALGSVLMLGGQVDAATAVLEQAIAELPADANDTGLALELDLWRVSQFGLVVRQRATARHPRFTPTPGTPPGPGWLARDGIELALTRGPAPDAAALAHRALANGRLLDAEGSESPIFQMAANTLILAGETTAARDAYDEAIAQATRRGSIRGFALCNVFRALLHRDAGNLADAEADARAYLEHAHAAGPAHRLAVAALVVVMLERGDPDDAAAVLHEQAPEPGDEASAGHLLQARARLCIAFGRTDEALAALEELAEHERAWGIGTPAMTQWRAYAAEVHTARGDTATARTLADEEVERARQFGAAGVLGTALLAAATVDEPAMRVERLREAVACLAPSPARLRHAQALISLGSELRRAGQRVEARPLLTGGVALARACGAIALAEHGYDELAAAGSRPRRLLRTGVDALTPSERRVAQMAAAGSSNRDIAQALFLSVRTVETHLARAYPKLGVTSRDGLLDALDEPAGPPA